MTADVLNRNRLGEERSLYLREHADQPVRWQPWDESALSAACDSGKPILLSIGYSACHWCHVMARESFADEHIAAVMNEHYVNIKVDREERPDLDQIYQTAHLLMQGRGGGWPLTVFMTPDDHRPFFIGTYFPPSAGMHLPGFHRVLTELVRIRREDPAVIQKQAASVADTLHLYFNQTAGDGDPPGRVEFFRVQSEAANQLERISDVEHGGFGGAPKFPMEPQLRFLSGMVPDEAAETEQAALARKQAQWAHDHALLSLRHIADGGICDHLAGGFFRYAVDNDWHIPHFEKMLYDNGQLLSLYAWARPFWKDEAEQQRMDRVVEDTAAWVMHAMQSADGGYYAALDADDAQGREGGFYLWKEPEVKALLSEDQWRVFRSAYGARGMENFEGQWHLTREGRDGVVCALSAEEEILLQQARTVLAQVRARRQPHQRDDKMISSWNGLMISGMAQAARACQRDDWLASAERALDRLHRRHWRDGVLAHQSIDGSVGQAGFLSDYAFCIEAVMDVLSCRWNSAEMDFAIGMAEAMLTHFVDEKDGGLFINDGAEVLLCRPKPFEDEAVPAGNGAAARVLARLGHLLAEPRYVRAAERIVHSGSGYWRRAPQGCCSLLQAWAELAAPPPSIIVRGPAAVLPDWLAVCPPALCHVLPIPDDAADLPAALKEKPPAADGIAYLCEGSRCFLTVRTPDELRAYLAEQRAAAS